MYYLNLIAIQYYVHLIFQVFEDKMLDLQTTGRRFYTKYHIASSCYTNSPCDLVEIASSVHFLLSLCGWSLCHKSYPCCPLEMKCDSKFEKFVKTAPLIVKVIFLLTDL